MSHERTGVKLPLRRAAPASEPLRGSARPRTSTTQRQLRRSAADRSLTAKHPPQGLGPAAEAEAPLADRLRDRLLELPLGVGALDPSGDLAGAVEREHPRLAAQPEGRHLWPDAAVDPVVPKDLHVDELHVLAALRLHLLGDVHHRPADTALAELRRGEQE